MIGNISRNNDIIRRAVFDGLLLSVMNGHSDDGRPVLGALDTRSLSSSDPRRAARLGRRWYGRDLKWNSETAVGGDRASLLPIESRTETQSSMSGKSGRVTTPSRRRGGHFAPSASVGSVTQTCSPTSLKLMGRSIASFTWSRFTSSRLGHPKQKRSLLNLPSRSLFCLSPGASR